jgi:hypothetical protein
LPISMYVNLNRNWHALVGYFARDITQGKVLDASFQGVCAQRALSCLH